MSALYNDNDKFVCEWLESLAYCGVIADGYVECSPIQEVDPEMVSEFTQFHAFAGIGGWSYALQLAGVADDSPVWTGSCPCQPFSVAGKRKGTSDDRHLWPAWFALIRECLPPVIFGEQVASPLGREWLDSVSADLEGVGYAVGSADLCAAGVGAPHIRQRLWFVAYSISKRLEGRESEPGDDVKELSTTERGGSSVGRVAHPDSQDQSGRRVYGPGKGADESEGAARERPAGLRQADSGHPRPTDGFWRDPDWLFCRDEKFRPVEPGTFPLAHGIPARVGRLRGYGNAIVPQVAAVFIRAALDSILGLEGG